MRELRDPLFVRIHYQRAIFDDGSELKLPEWVTAVSWHEAQGMHDNWCGWVLHTGVTDRSSVSGIEITGIMIPCFRRSWFEESWRRTEAELASAKSKADADDREPPNRNNRVVICRIDENELLDAFLREKPPEYVRVTGRSMPDGYKVERVVHNPLGRCFDVLVSHDSFPEIPLGMWLPEQDADWLVKVIRVQPAEDEPADDEPIIVAGVE